MDTTRTALTLLDATQPNACTNKSQVCHKRLRKPLVRTRSRMLATYAANATIHALETLLATAARTRDENKARRTHIPRGINRARGRTFANGKKPAAHACQRPRARAADADAHACTNYKAPHSWSTSDASLRLA